MREAMLQISGGRPNPCYRRESVIRWYSIKKSRATTAGSVDLVSFCSDL